ncbi:MAG TPA: hypothetical protein VF720_06320 [Candidatus Eisenbacteria bacterium]
MGPEFLGRIVKTSLMLSVGLALVAGWYFGVDRGVDFGFAALWGTLNLKMLQKVIVEATRPGGLRMEALVSAFLVKFPLLYGTGAVWMLKRHPDPAATFAGLSLVLAVILLKSLGRLLMDSAWFSRPMAGGEDR